MSFWKILMNFLRSSPLLVGRTLGPTTHPGRRRMEIRMLFLHEALAGFFGHGEARSSKPSVAAQAPSALAGESVASPADSSPEQMLSQLSKMEISLTLTSKLVPAASSEENDTRSLMLR